MLFTALLSCGSQLGQGLIMQQLVGSFLPSMGWLGTSSDISEYFLWIVGSWEGGGFKSIFFLGDENGFEKLGRNGFLSHPPTYLV